MASEFQKDRDLDIFVITYKDFKPVVHDSVYKVVDSRKIDESKYPLTDRFFSEILQMFYIADNFELKKYVGINHYRRYFSFLDDIPDMDEIFEKSEVILTKPLRFRSTVREQYASCHNVEDLDIMKDIIDEKYPEYSEIADIFINKTHLLFTCNMFIMKREDFLDYVAFVRGVLYEYINRVGTDIYKRIEENKDKYLKPVRGYPQNDKPWYQYRIGGYLGERLTNIFIGKRFKKIRMSKIVLTDGKYEKGITDEEN
jgi:hypothetical protein